MERLEVLVLTGFLGSGKTTLLNRLLRGWPRSLVLINEFGAEAIDPRLVADRQVQVTTLAGGCLCCQVRGALAPTLKNLWLGWRESHGARCERLIIETSGVASPEPVLDTLLRERWLAARYRLTGVVATVAAPCAAEQLDRFPEAVAQVAWADLLVLTHTDRVEPAVVEVLERRLAVLAPGAARRRAVRGELDLAVLQLPAFRPRPVPPPVQGTVEHGFDSAVVVLTRPVAWECLRPVLEALWTCHPELLRIKGVVYLTDAAEPMAVHGVGGRLTEPRSLPARAGDDGTGRLVLITTGPVAPVAQAVALALSGQAVLRPAERR